MRSFDDLPKSLKKTVRYINQDVSYAQFKLVKRILLEAIEKKEQTFYRKRS